MQIIYFDASLSEFLSVFLKKYSDDITLLKSCLANIHASFNVVNFDSKDLENALNIRKRYKLSYYDSLIITSALENDCTLLYSEDMHHKLKIEKRLSIINPFK